MTVLPASVRLALWATRALGGELDLPTALRLATPDADHVQGALARLQLWRDLGERVVLVALPRPGDLTGLPRGVLEFSGAAAEARECVFVPGVGGALVPEVDEFGPEGDQVVDRPVRRLGEVPRRRRRLHGHVVEPNRFPTSAWMRSPSPHRVSTHFATSQARSLRLLNLPRLAGHSFLVPR